MYYIHASSKICLNLYTTPGCRFTYVLYYTHWEFRCDFKHHYCKSNLQMHMQQRYEVMKCSRSKLACWPPVSHSTANLRNVSKDVSRRMFQLLPVVHLILLCVLKSFGVFDLSVAEYISTNEAMDLLNFEWFGCCSIAFGHPAILQASS